MIKTIAFWLGLLTALGVSALTIFAGEEFDKSVASVIGGTNLAAILMIWYGLS